ncbi:CRISPR-associated endoribonuclease Cas6 [Alkaliphilus sp. B6464]|uniref:CRISPR-associated endoribonuclease Cas6 n=1 Tax=Alkaliphilus sp. B6464 TaxID=2731219 RepID=UPI001BA905EB|nr:CRISPR-associated endoribonuclease Cas6 [Alkaliphilus sp. B6464]QUH21806.1 hypothetical protein HYG84_17880 [Alkaliphilus sp. B6464]
MKVYELTISIILKKDISYLRSHEEIAAIINKAMLLDKDLKNIHKKNTFKYYIFSNLYPAIKGEDYKLGNVYSFRIRSVKREFLLKLKELLKRTENSLFNILAIEFNLVKKTYIDGLFTATPSVCVITEEGKRPKHWTKYDYGMKMLEKRINNNIIRKYEQFTGSKLPNNLNVIRGIELINKKPIVIPYKNGYLLGNKFKMYFQEDDLSQELAYMMLGVGALEKGSLGMGYCTYIK